MPDMNGSWEQLMDELTSLETAEYDDEWAEGLDDEDYDESAESDDELSEASPFSRLRRARRGAPVARAHPTRSYAGAVKGRNQGVVSNPNGPAKVMLPGTFPTVDEFRKTVSEIQRDVQKNSKGIQDLADQQRKESARVTALMVKSERRLRKQMQRTQLIAAISASIPLVARLLLPNNT